MIMFAEEYLMQLGNLNAAIAQDMERLADLRTRAAGLGGIRYDRDHVQTTASDTMADAVSKIIEIDKRIQRNVDRYADARETIIEQIRGLHDETYTKILYDVYVMGLSLTDTATDIGMSRNSVSKYHRQALEAFREAYAPFEYLV